MPEDHDVDAQTGESPNDPSSEVSLNHNGKVLKMTRAKRDTLAQQALHQEDSLRKLKAEREKLEKDQEAWDYFRNFQGQLKANPTMAEAVQAAVQDPQSVMSALQRGDDSYDDDDEGTPMPKPQAGSQEIEALRAEIAALKANDQQRSVRETAKQADKRIESEIADYPWIKPGTKTHDLAKDRIAALMANNPDGGLPATVAHVADEFRQIIGQEKQSRLDGEKDRSKLRTLDPNRSVPSFKPKEDLKKGSFNDGTMTKNLKEAAAAFFGGD